MCVSHVGQNKFFFLVGKENGGGVGGLNESGNSRGKAAAPHPQVQPEVHTHRCANIRAYAWPH